MTIPSEGKGVTQALQAVFGNDLTAVYLYGSATGGGLRPNSDVDILAVVTNQTTPVSRRDLGRELLRISGRYPPVSGQPRPLEVSVFAQDVLTHFHHPVQGEFLYGEWLREAFEADEDIQPATNPDYTLLLAQARQQGVALFGPEANVLLPIIGAQDIRQAIMGALPDLLGSLAGDERNVLLTLARMWFTMSTGSFASKDAAADWVIERAPANIAATMQRARGGYLGTVADEWGSKSPEAQLAAKYLGDRVADAG